MTTKTSIALALSLLGAVACAEDTQLDESYSGINPYSDFCADYAGCRYPQFNDASMRTKGADWVNAQNGIVPRAWNQQWNASCGTQQMPYFELLRGVDMWQEEHEDYMFARSEMQAGRGNFLEAGWNRLEVKLRALEQLEILPAGKVQDIIFNWNFADAAKFGLADDNVTPQTGQEYLSDMLLAAYNELNQVAKRKVLDADGNAFGDWVNIPCDDWVVMQNLAKGQDQYGVMCSNLLGENRLDTGSCPLPIGEAFWQIKDTDGNVRAEGYYYSGPDQACGTGSVTFSSDAATFEVPGFTKNADGSYTGTVNGNSAGKTSYAVPMTIDGHLFETWFETEC